MLKINLAVNKEKEKVFSVRHVNSMYSIVKPEDEDTTYKVPRAWLENENNIQVLQGNTVLVKAGEIYEES